MSDILQKFMSALDERGIEYVRGTWGDVIFQREDGTRFSVKSTIDRKGLYVTCMRASLDDAISEIFGDKQDFCEESHSPIKNLWTWCTALRKAGLTDKEISRLLGISELTVLSLIGEGE